MHADRASDHAVEAHSRLEIAAFVERRVAADWPGLGDAALYEGRDLKPTASLDSVIGGAVGVHFGLDPQRAMPALFPGQTTKPIGGLIRG